MKTAYIVKAYRTAVGKAPKGVFRLKRPDEFRVNTLVEINENIFMNDVKMLKKRSALSIFSRRTYAVQKCIILNKRISKILIIFYNMILHQRYWPKR